MNILNQNSNDNIPPSFKIQKVERSKAIKEEDNEINK